MDFDSVPQSMYVFEGTDYSNEPSAADKKAFDDLVSGMYRNDPKFSDSQVLANSVDPDQTAFSRNMFLSSPHFCFIIVFICDLFVSRDDPLMS